MFKPTTKQLEQIAEFQTAGMGLEFAARFLGCTPQELKVRLSPGPAARSNKNGAHRNSTHTDSAQGERKSTYARKGGG
jgi:hypothetical protein